MNACSPTSMMGDPRLRRTARARLEKRRRDQGVPLPPPVAPAGQPRLKPAGAWGGGGEGVERAF